MTAYSLPAQWGPPAEESSPPAQQSSLAEPPPANDEAYDRALKSGRWKRVLAGVVTAAGGFAVYAGAAALALTPAALVVAGVAFAATAAWAHKSGQRDSNKALQKLGHSEEQARYVSQPLNIFTPEMLAKGAIAALLGAAASMMVFAIPAVGGSSHGMIALGAGSAFTDRRRRERLNEVLAAKGHPPVPTTRADIHDAAKRRRKTAK